MRKNLLIKIYLAVAAFLAALLTFPVECFGAIPSREIQDQLIKQAARELPKKAVIHLENAYSRTSIPRRGVTVSLLNSNSPLGLISFEAHWVDSNGATQKAFGSCVVKATALVAVSRAPIRHGESFQDSNIGFERRELSQFTTVGYYTDWQKLLPLRANGYIRPGTVIGASQAIVPSAVERGQVVDLIHTQGGLRIIAKVRALEAGLLKSWIRVENPSSKKVLLARVVAPGEVRLR